MAKTNVQITLDRPAGPYYPGDVVRATVHLENEKEMVARAASACLLLREKYQWRRVNNKGRGENRNETDEATFATVDLWSESVIPPGKRSYPAELQIPPDAAAPYAGKITENGWWVKATFDCPKSFDPEAEVEVPLLVPAPGLHVEPLETGEAERSEEAELRLWLPRLEWVEGETLAGKLLVRPSANFSVNEVRLELIRTEYVPERSGHTHTSTEGKVKLADGVEFWPSQPVEYPFTLTLPRKGQPTRVTRHSRTSWTLVGTLARRLRKDAELRAVIEVYAGRK